jgi:Cd2+/Zn2+-exporting ATPase
VAFDKTGTLTHGRPTITDVRTFNSVSKDEVLRTAALLELKSEHPLAEALIEYAFNNGIVIDSVEVDEFESMPGKGIRGRIRGQFFFLGNHQLAKEHGICGPAIEQHLFDLERQGKTVMILANRDEVFGLIAIQDQVRVQSEKALKSLRAIGVEHVVLLSGDNKSISTIVGKNVGVDTVHSNLLPEDKLRLIAGLQEQFGSVAMVGEGVNDAPALAAANVGIAMGDAGSDTALETADVVLMSDDLEKLPFAMKIGKKSLSIIRQNVIFALIVKSLFIILGILGISSLWLAILADDGVTLLVAMNGMRLLRMK